jgi:hypothetical protein
MRIPWRVREYERTCNNCGYVWRVPKAIARPPVRGLPTAPRERIARVVRDVIAENAALAERAEATRSCAKCESRQYKQRSIWS